MCADRFQTTYQKMCADVSGGKRDTRTSGQSGTEAPVTRGTPSKGRNLESRPRSCVRIQYTGPNADVSAVPFRTAPPNPPSRNRMDKTTYQATYNRPKFSRFGKPMVPFKTNSTRVLDPRKDGGTYGASVLLAHTLAEGTNRRGLDPKTPLRRDAHACSQEFLH
eukprot:gnl/Spiro4/25063_TR12467_c0_g1_i1.p2 gnl/Spiro4/25063_TR12467_c0_g1~~gnl/Spiro4/25063_TR12467_c0_g1_i1.p2  ORF type:complete len:188 (+),score=30.27 gnl/Spiro4/25063_TR12467_c0_g1_i1:75-566(+)